MLSPAAAANRAERTGRRVTVSALTTPNSATTVRPDGTFTVTESALPVRAWRNGRWRPLNAALHANPDGTLSPAVTTSRLVLSGGGRAPLAVLSAGPRQLSVSWPRPLPAPVISGATATYRGVLPGVDLVLTADKQGGFSDVLVITSARAAANPALRSIRLTVAAQGLVLSASKAGNLTAAAGRTAPPLFGAQPPLAWDSAPPPAGTRTARGPGGIAVNRATGMPAYSSVTAPGASARVTKVPVSLSGDALTLAPPASMLTGKDVTYPVYIDPTWYSVGAKASDWTQVDSGFATTSYWHESSDLQVGDCPSSITPPSQSCNGMGVARSFFKMPIPSALTGSTVINSAHVYMTEVWAPSCTKKSVRLYTTGGISSSTTWNHQPSWSSSYLYQDAAFGYPGCGYYTNDIAWDVTSTISGDVGHQSTQTWGMRAADETDQYAWKQFKSGSSNITMSVTYNDPPNNPTSRATSPGGACQYSASGAPVIGNDDVTFSAYVSDNDGDNSLTNRFIILNSSGTTVYDSKTAGTSDVTGNKTTARLILNRQTMQGLQAGGTTTEFTYHWYVITTDNNSLNSNNPADDCYIKYNPLGPSAPTLTVPGSGQLGQTVAATFTAPPNCSPTGSPCPVSYVYQLGARAPVTVTADASGNWSGTLPVTQLGPIELTVYAMATGGNPGESATAEFLGTAPAVPYADGYFSGGTYPDLLTLGTGNKPSLWLRPGTGSGGVGPATDIGSLGTGVNPGTDGPGDWAGTTVLHGDFTSDGVQDVMAYYPSTGNGVVIAGNGNASSLVPDSGNVSIAQSALMASGDTGDTPGQALVGAGNASELSTGADDMIGVSGDPTNGYELDLYTNGLCTGCAFAGGYGWDETLAIQAPDGTADWQNYALATAQPGGSPGATVLFALDKATGALYESTNPGQSATSVVGSGNWAQISVPWGASPPALVSADVSHAGQTELWTLSGGTATAYVLNGSTLGGEGAGSPANAPTNDWALTDGSPLAQAGATTATDSVTGSSATLTSGVTWGDDDYFSADASFDGQSGYLTPPSGTIPGSATTPSVSVWFKTTTADGVLVSAQGQALSAGGTTGGGYNPVMYVGTDGKLRAEWWNGTAATPITSAAAVNDGLWHHAVLTATGNTQFLDIDGKLQGTLPGAVNLSGEPNLDFGAGYLGGSWPTEPHYKQSGNNGYLDYFNGELADITASTVPAVTGGYWAYTAHGNVFNVAGAPWYGSQAGNISNGAGLAITPDGLGYWLVTATGTVYAYGDATTGTSVPSPACPITGAVGNPTGGYYAYTACGNIYNEAGAPWYGSQAGKITNGAGLAVTADGGGYWLITATGTVYAYGDATTGTSISPACSIIGAAGDPAGGYFAYTACGNVYQEAGAVWDGSQAGNITNGAGLAVTADGGGYWLITSTGTVYAYGDATGGTSITSNYGLTGAAGSPAR